MAQEQAAAIELRGIVKRFGSVVANKNVDLTLNHGEILALLGENGSGKTTLMNMISGIYRPDAGAIYINGREAHISSPRDAYELGVGMIHQHFKLVDAMSAKENIVLGTHGRVRAADLTREIKKLCDRFGLEIDPDKPISAMSVGEKQTVEILKVLYRGCNILILDEPTAVLTPQETRRLFDILRRMKKEGCAVIIITHKLHEVLSISDRVTILRKGESVGSVETSKTNVRELTEMMVGRSVKLEIERTPRERGRRRLEVSNLCVKDEDGLPALTDVSFDLDAGEILGVAGIAGSGQRELCESIAGLHLISFGKIKLDGQDLEGLNPREIMQRGIAMSFVPEDRLGMGLVGSMSVSDNVLLKSYYKNHGMFVDRAAARSLSKKMVDELEISTPSVMHPVGQLSGGNVQKVLLGREIHLSPRVLMAAYPVRGLDINSSYKIYELINGQKAKGVGVLFVGEDLDVLIELCDRIMVLCAGRVTGIIDVRAELGEPEDASTISREDEEADSRAMQARQRLKERLGALMTGFVEEESGNE
ncbi:MAG: ABC transporter ATP-binding protein [Candidatus Fimadaptatus sp.]